MLALVAVIFVPSTGDAGRALRRLDAADRQTLFAATKADAEAVCKHATGDEAFRKRCGSSAAFLLAFPECDATCRAFAYRFARSPSR